MSVTSTYAPSREDFAARIAANDNVPKSGDEPEHETGREAEDED